MTTEAVNAAIEGQKKKLLDHSLYQNIRTVADLHRFLENHVYAVWDFMSLLKALQQRLTCATTPWLAVGDPEIRYLINVIVLAEETDLALDGKRASHFEMYLEAMEDCGADTSQITSFLNGLTATDNIFVSIRQSGLHPNVKSFLDFTFQTIEEGKPHKIAAAFTFGREDLIPTMFTAILKNFQANFPNAGLDKLVYYFERHIELDADEHGPMAMQMVAALCGDERTKWDEATQTALLALEKRMGLWDAIKEQLVQNLETA